MNAAITDKLESRNWGNLLLALDPALLGDAAAFKQRAAALLQRVQDARPLPGSAGPALPGRRGDALAGVKHQLTYIDFTSNSIQLKAPQEW